jgi:hypothetical protein
MALSTGATGAAVARGSGKAAGSGDWDRATEGISPRRSRSTAVAAALQGVVRMVAAFR